MKILVDKTIKAAKPMFDTLNKLDIELHKSDNTPTDETLKTWARKACGAGNYVEKKYLIFSAMKKNEEFEKYEENRLAISIKNEKFVSAIADKESKAYVATLRMARDIFLSYVHSADRILSTVRLHLQNQPARILDAHI